MADDLGFVCPECKTPIKYTAGMTLGEVLSLRHNSQHQAVKIDALKMDNNAKGARIAALEAAIDKVLVAVSQSKMVPKPGCGVGGQSIDANIRGSDYLRVDAWSIEELRDARAALEKKDD